MLELIENKDFGEIRRQILEMNVVDVAEFISQLDDEATAVLVFRLMPKETASDVFAYLEGDVRQRIVEAMSDKELTFMINELFLDDTVDFLEEMPASIVRRVIKLANRDTRKYINQLLMYPEDSAGSLMTIELMRLDSAWSIERAISEIRRRCEEAESLNMLFVTDTTRKLQGVVHLRSVLAAEDTRHVSDIMESDVISVNTHTDQAEVAEMFKKYDLLSMPVVDNENRLVGLITIDDVVDVMEEETTEDIYKMAAMQPNESTYLDTSVFKLAKNRIVWLMVLMISATFTGIIIQRFETALAANLLLTSFIPMLMDTSGNAGSQSSVSVIRALVLNEVAFKDILKIIWKEFRVSILVGLAVAVVNFLRIWIFNHDPLIAAIVSVTLLCTIICAKFVGCSLPLLAAKIKLDPAIMASPMITTIVDAVSLLIYFNIAMALL